MKKRKKTPTDPRQYAIVFVMVLWGLTAVTYVVPPDWYAQYIIDAAQDVLVVDKVEGVYEATATILALVSFGSVLGVRLSTNKDAAGRQLGGLVLVSGGSLLVIIIQVLVMNGLCCGSLLTSQYLVYNGLMGVSLMGIVLGYATIVIAQNVVASSRIDHTTRIRGTVNRAAKNPKANRTRNRDTRQRQPPPNKPSTTKSKAKARRTRAGNASKGR